MTQKAWDGTFAVGVIMISKRLYRNKCPQVLLNGSKEGPSKLIDDIISTFGALLLSGARFSVASFAPSTNKSRRKLLKSSQPLLLTKTAR
jgi:hypothetical protein